MFPAPMRAMCAQVWLVPTSVRVLHTLERGTAAYWGGGEAQEAACGGSKVATPAILSRLPDPVLAVRLQDCKISTFGRALHHLAGPSAGSVQQRAGQPRARMSGSFLRSQSCDIAAAATGLIAIRNTRDGLLAPQSSSLLT